MILRIDDIVASSSGKNQQTPPTNPNMNMDFQGMMG
jgi:hypothetical protein